MTIHKSQGQSFDRVDIYVPNGVFTHGQLYIAMSRVRSPEGLNFLMHKEKTIENIVYKELLE